MFQGIHARHRSNDLQGEKACIIAGFVLLFDLVTGKRLAGEEAHQELSEIQFVIA